MTTKREQLNDLLTELTSATASGNLRWTPAGDPLSYRLRLSSGTVLLNSQLIRDSYTLVLVDGEGEELLKHSEGIMAGALLSKPDDPIEPGKLRQLYELVRTQVSEASPEVDRFLDELRQQRGN